MRVAHAKVARCRSGASQRRRITCLSLADRARAAAAVANADRAVAITVLRRTRIGMGTSDGHPSFRDLLLGAETTPVAPRIMLESWSTIEPHRFATPATVYAPDVELEPAQPRRSLHSVLLMIAICLAAFLWAKR